MSIRLVYFVMFDAVVMMNVLPIAKGSGLFKHHYLQTFSLFLDHSEKSAITKRQTDECFTDAVVNCSQQIQDLDPFQYEDNITEFKTRIEQFTNVVCTQPCHSTLLNYYKCMNGSGSALLINETELVCVEIENEFCYPQTAVAFLNVSDDDSFCNNYTTPNCSMECQTETRSVVDSLGCCGVEVLEVGQYVSADEDATLFSNVLSCLGDDYDCNSAPTLNGLGPVGAVAMGIIVTIMSAMVF